MAKERFLTVLVPIKDDDCVNASAAYASKQALKSAVPVNMDNINKIYKVSYTSSGNTVVEYYRYIPDIDNADYTLVVDREFPYLITSADLWEQYMQWYTPTIRRVHIDIYNALADYYEKQLKEGTSNQIQQYLENALMQLAQSISILTEACG